MFHVVRDSVLRTQVGLSGSKTSVRYPQPFQHCAVNEHWAVSMVQEVIGSSLIVVAAYESTFRTRADLISSVDVMVSSNSDNE